ncbi:TolB family protein [Acidobacteriota bacterium]
MKKFLIICVAITAVFFGSLTQGYAQAHDFIDLTSLLGNGAMPNINDHGDMVWLYVESPSFTASVYFYDSSNGEVTLVKSTPNKLNICSFNNRGDLCLMERFGSAYDLFLYDTNTHLMTRLTNDGVRDSAGKLNEAGDVVWSKHDGSDYEIMLYQRATGAITQFTNNTLNDSSPAINNNGDIAWTQHDGNDNEVVLYDKTTGTIAQITDDIHKDSSPMINDNQDINWKRNDGNDDEIMFYNGTTEIVKQLSNNNWRDYLGDMNSQGNVVWHLYDLWLPTLDPAEIFFYDKEADAVIQITDNDKHDRNPRINDSNQVVWYGGSDWMIPYTFYEIHLYDHRTGITTLLMPNPDTYERDPNINNRGEIVWHNLTTGEAWMARPKGLTVEGTDVAIQPADSTTGEAPLTMTFQEVTDWGMTTLETSETGPESPSGLQLGTPPTFFDIETTAEHFGSIEICVSYEEGAYTNEEDLRLMHYSGYQWEDITTSLDTDGNRICGTTSSLSEFTVMRVPGYDLYMQLIKHIQDSSIPSGTQNSLIKKLQNSLASLMKGNTKAASNQLKAFQNEVKAQSGKKKDIDEGFAAILLNLSDELAAVLMGL